MADVSRKPNAHADVPPRSREATKRAASVQTLARHNTQTAAPASIICQEFPKFGWLACRRERRRAAVNWARRLGGWFGVLAAQGFAWRLDPSHPTAAGPFVAFPGFFQN